MCVKVSYANKSNDGSLHSIGGDDSWGGAWGLTIAEAVLLIKSGEWLFFVERPSGDPVRIEVASRQGREFIKTVADGDNPNNLLELPPRNSPLISRPPQFPASLPGARVPTALTVFRPGQPPTAVTSPPRMFGAFPTMPGSVILRFIAPWPAELEVKIDSSNPLERSVSSTTSRPDLDAVDKGWYKILSLTNLDRIKTNWEILVVPPPSRRRGPRPLTITVAQISINPDCFSRPQKEGEDQAYSDFRQRVGSEFKSAAIAVTLRRGIQRRNIYDFNPNERLELLGLMNMFLTDSIVAAHTMITHSGAHLLNGHRAYIQRLEEFLLTAPGNRRRFVPLPKWDPGDPIPNEFQGIRPLDGGGLLGRPPLNNLTPNLPLPATFRQPNLCTFGTAENLGNAIDSWHGSVHVAVGGTMRDALVASAAPIFWLWHAFIDDVFLDWELCS